MKRTHLAVSICALLLSSVALVEARVVLRLGTVAPKGSSWELIMRRMGAEWGTATDDEVRLRIYAGGTVGDEGEMIRKMRIGQLQAAGISNAGLAEIDPRAYALMLPMMFDSYEEWDYVRRVVNPILEEKLAEKGFIVLTWSDVGWVYFFTKGVMRSPADLQAMKLAGSHTETRTIDIFKWAGFNPVPISTVDMMTGFQTGLIDSTYAPVIFAEGSQLYRQASNMTNMKWAPLQGAVVMHENGWKKLTPDQQADVLRITRQVGEDLRESNREQERRSLDAMTKRGLNVIDISDDVLNQWRAVAEKAYPRVRDNLVPPEIFDRVEQLRDEFRAQQETLPLSETTRTPETEPKPEAASFSRLHAIENGVSVAALFAMALLPLAESIVRTVYPSGISGSMIWVQHLALWVGFLGAAIAARRGELLSLTAGAQLVGARSRQWIDIVVGGISVAVCLVLVYGSLELVSVEREGGRALALGLPVWLARAIMPIGFGVIGLRILRRASPTWKGRLVAASFAIVPIALWRFEALQETGIYLPLLIALIAATALGAPIFISIGGVAAVLLWHDFFPVSAIPTETYNLAIKPILPTIPLFTLAGFILAEGGTPRRLVALFTALVGWLPGGVAVVAIVVCAFFTSFTGGSGVTILAMGGLMFPMLLDRKYTPKFSTGLLTSAGSLGLLFPPSLAVILYGLVAEVELRQLFVAGFIPAILEIGIVAAFALWAANKVGIERVSFNAQRALTALWNAKWEVMIPVVVLGSILGGFAALVEAASITVLYAFVLEFLIHRDLKIRKDLLRVGGDAATLIGGVLIILGVALGLTNYLIFAEIPQAAVDWVQTIVSSPLVFLLLLNIFLLIVGCLMDIYSAIVVVVPLITPLGIVFGIDPFHLGIIFLTNMELGYLTPPVGMNLFLASYRFKQPLPDVYRAALPFLAIRAVAVVLVTYVPWLTQFLPALVWGD